MPHPRRCTKKPCNKLTSFCIRAQNVFKPKKIELEKWTNICVSSTEAKRMEMVSDYPFPLVLFFRSCLSFCIFIVFFSPTFCIFVYVMLSFLSPFFVFISRPMIGFIMRPETNWKSSQWEVIFFVIFLINICFGETES